MTKLNHRTRLSVEVLEDRAMPSTFRGLSPPAGHSQPRSAPVTELHTYQTSFAAEVAHTIAVSADKLLPLLPDEYELVPAAALGLGGLDQGIVAIANYRGDDPRLDQRRPRQEQQVAIDVVILVNEPAEAEAAGVNIPGAFHFYTLAIYTNDPQYAASLRVADMPVEFVPGITYDRQMDDATGVGEVMVGVPSRDSPFSSISTGFGYQPAGALNAVFWYNGKRGKAVLHFHDEPFQQGQALSQVYLEPGSRWEELLAGGGLGSGMPHPVTGYPSVVTPSLNLRYAQGSRGRLLLIAPPVRVKNVQVNDGAKQRSMVQSLTVSFDREVMVDPGAFELRRQDGALISLIVATSVMDGRTVAELTFAGSGIIGSSLADGNYSLTIRSDLVHDAIGRSLDGDGDGNAGGDHSDSFFRLFGDSDGDRDVDRRDLARMLSALGHERGDRHYLAYMDFTGDDRVGVLDLLAFVHRLGTRQRR